MPPKPSVGRARLSCLPCRKRKSKCDEQMEDPRIALPRKPCSSCILRGTSHTCDLPESSQKSQSPKARHLFRDATLDDLSSHPQAHKRHRPSSQEDKRTTVSSSEALSEIDNVRQGLTRLETFVKDSPSEFSVPWTTLTPQSLASHSPPTRLDTADEIVAILPCQSDCETLFEFLLQEADWMVTCIGVQWLHPIWCHFVYGGRVSRAEGVLLVVTLAVAALLLAEGPHIYYSMAAALEPLHEALIDYVVEYFFEQRTSTATSASPRDTLNRLAILGLAFDYLRFSAHRRKRDQECWMLVREGLHKLAQESGTILDERSNFWQGLDVIETEYARRVAWHLIICERWGGMYHEPGAVSPFRQEEISVEHPRWIRTSPSAPFRAMPNPAIPAEEQVALEFRPSPKNVARLFRLKQDAEVQDVPLFAELFISLSEQVSAVAKYVSAIELWRSQRQSSANAARGSSIDHRREALLHQGIVLSSDIKAWQQSFAQRCSEPEHLDPSDYLACRTASQAAIIHVGRRQILNVVLSAWVTEESVMAVDSPLLAQLQREAFDNARDAVRSIEVTRTLLSCGKVLHIPWAALAFFSAATTLAIPLLGAGRQRLSTQAEQDFPRVFRIDKLLNFSTIDQSQSEAGAAIRRTPSPAVSPFYPSSSSSRSMSGQSTRTAFTTMTTNSPQPVLNMDEMRTLAPDILRILDFLPNYNAHLLRDEARQRLAMLVETYGTVSQDPPHVEPPSTADSAVLAKWTELQRDTVGPDFGIADLWADARGSTVLDSLVALDDTWWKQLLRDNVVE